MRRRGDDDAAGRGLGRGWCAVEVGGDNNTENIRRRMEDPTATTVREDEGGQWRRGGAEVKEVLGGR